jgi:phosphoribosylamine--glycine ligase/phosphoribosylformylglycinamidine cyclo-ligase
MNVLLIGNGGREHAVAWKLTQSPRLSRLFIAPGNSGTYSLGENVSLDPADHQALCGFCIQEHIDIVIVGPETPLADGITDALQQAGIRCFGPTMAAAQIEASKVFSKNFMARHGIPTARYANFTTLEDALAHVSAVSYPIVIKASGLAAGKGVMLPDSHAEAVAALETIFVEKAFGAAGREVVIEERLEGQEVSLMAFTDGKSVVAMLPAQDHKRAFDGDNGPNTGGMGAYAPAPVFTSGLLQDALETVLQPAVSGLRLEGMPFVGVLYAGLMLTSAGLRVLEFNCRFGDPETQAVLPLLETDLLDIVEACLNGSLKEIDIRWKAGSAVCVVLASGGYPGRFTTGLETSGSLESYASGVCFHAGARREGDRIVTHGGRVFGVTAWAGDLDLAVQAAYTIAGKIYFEGMHYRKDIARRALKRSAYARAGVSIDAGNRAVNLMKDAVKATYTPAVLAGIGSFGGLFDASALKAMARPVLVASADGVGTKVKLAAQAGRYRSIGHDIVNHCINDILVQGAAPLFFMDYFATSQLNPEQAAEVVTGIAEACREAGMALLGGETAEMPGVYMPGEFDVAGTIVGVVERENILPRTSELKPGDALVGLASSGPHTNGYSLIRKVFSGISLKTVYPELGGALEDGLLAPHRSYLKILGEALERPGLVKALAHLTGGGFIENIPRVLPGHLSARVVPGSWPIPPLWSVIQKQGSISAVEMYRVFNMGIGMVVIVDSAHVEELLRSIPEPAWEIGVLEPGDGKVILGIAGAGSPIELETARR